MTMRKTVQALALCCVAALGIFSMIASGPPRPPSPSAPAAPTLLSLEIPNNVFGNAFSGIAPAIPATATAPATYFVLPLLPTTAPIVRTVLRTPYPSDLAVTATDTSRGVSATLPQLPSGSTGTSTGFFQVISLVPNDPATWTIVIRYPDSFQGSKSISTSITDTVGGTPSPPLTFVMAFRGSTVTVTRVTANNDGRIRSNPPGIDCPGVCSFDFMTSTSVLLAQSVVSNSTEFTGWTGNCSGTGGCLVQLLAPGAAIIPVNPSVTANFRIRANTSIPPTMLCPTAPLVAGRRWVAQPHCGSPPPLGATLQCDAQGYFCCGVSGGVATARCPGGNETPATCAADSLGVFGSNLTLIQPGGCYERSP